MSRRRPPTPSALQRAALLAQLSALFARLQEQGCAVLCVVADPDGTTTVLFSEIATADGPAALAELVEAARASLP